MLLSDVLVLPSNCSLSVGGKCSSHLASLSLTFGTSHEALAFSLSFPHSFLNAPSSNQWVREQGPVGRTAPLPKKGVFNLSPPWPLLPFSLLPHATFLLLVILH